MLSDDNFPSLKKSIPASNNDILKQKPTVMKYSDVLKQKKTNINNVLKFDEIEKDSKNDLKTDSLINNISKKTENLSLEDSKTPLECETKPQQENNLNKNKNNKIQNNKNEDIHKKYQKDLDSIIKIQAWWRMVSTIKSMKNIKNNIKEEVKEKETKKEEVKEKEAKKEEIKEKETEKKSTPTVKTLPKKPSFSEIVKLAPPSLTTTENQNSNSKKPRRNRRNNNKNKYNENENENENENNNNNNNKNENEKKSKSSKVNEELNAIFKNMKFMGLIEKEIDALTEKNTIVNGKQFAKTKVVTIKRASRINSSSSTFSIDDIIDNTKGSKKKGNKNENKTSHKKNVCFNEKDEVFNEYNHVMKKLDLQKRCDKKSCLIDCYRRLYKREWEEDEETSEESSTSNSESEENNENPTTTLKKKSDYLYNDIYNPNYTKYYSGSDFDFGNRYFTGKERLKKALYLEPVEVTVQKIIYQPMKFQKHNKRYQPKKKNGNKRKQKN